MLPWGVVAVYAVAFGLFVNSYFTTYNDDIDVQFRYGVGDAVAYVKEQGFESVAVDSTVVYSHILFYDQTPQPEFAQTVECSNYPSPYLSVSSFGRYTFGVDMNDLDPNKPISSMSAAMMPSETRDTPWWSLASTALHFSNRQKISTLEKRVLIVYTSFMIFPSEEVY